jgi:hypothetical protein
MEHEVPSTYSQEPAIDPYLDPDKFIYPKCSLKVFRQTTCIAVLVYDPETFVLRMNDTESREMSSQDNEISFACY